MIEVSDALELQRSLTTRSGVRHAAWEWWAPGDATRYRVTFVVAQHVLGSAYHAFLTFEVGDDVITLRHGVDNPWTPERFLAAFGEDYAGWWAAIRPVLAAFQWTSTRVDDVTYDARDAVEIGELLTR